MRQLTLIRHAKSDWDAAGAADFERPLNKRGLSDAPMMGKAVSARGLQPDIVLSSPAARAATTARLISHELGYPEDGIQFIDSLYLASATDLLEQVNAISPDFHDALLVAHNPGISNFANFLCGDRNNELPGDLPTCAVVRIAFDTDDWQAIDRGTGSLNWYEYPRKHR